MKKPLPNATAVLVLGILSIPTSFCYGIVGLALGIIALVLAKKDKALYLAEPEEWDNFQNLNTGRTCAIVGVCLSGVMMLIMVAYLVFFATIMFPLISSAAASGAAVH